MKVREEFKLAPLSLNVDLQVQRVLLITFTYRSNSQDLDYQ